MQPGVHGVEVVCMVSKWCARCQIHLAHIMMPHMNPMFTDEVKEPRTRTSRPPKYYITDFGMSVQYSSDDPHPTETSPDGGDRTVPEFNNSTDLVEHDPFAVDIYTVGNVVKKEILDVCHSSIIVDRSKSDRGVFYRFTLVVTFSSLS